MECITDVSAGNTSWSLTMNFVISVGIFAQEDLHPCLAFVVIPCSSVAGWHHLKSCPVCSDFNLWCINLLIRLFSWRTLCLSFAKLIDSFIDLMPWFGMGSFSWSSPEESLWCAVLLLLVFCQMLSADVVASNKTAPALVRDLWNPQDPQSPGTNHDIEKVGLEGLPLWVHFPGQGECGEGKVGLCSSKLWENWRHFNFPVSKSKKFRPQRSIAHEWFYVQRYDDASHSNVGYCNRQM